MIIYDINELTKILKVSRATIIRYIKSKELKAFKVGNSWRITKESLLEYISKKEKLTYKNRNHNSRYKANG